MHVHISEQAKIKQNLVGKRHNNRLSEPLCDGNKPASFRSKGGDTRAPPNPGVASKGAANRASVATPQMWLINVIL